MESYIPESNLRETPINEKEIFTKLTSEVIKESFPTLEDKNIHVFTLNLKKWHGASISVPHSIKCIVLAKRAAIFNNFILKGLIAHELCHSERHMNMGLLEYLRYLFKYFTSQKARSKEERETEFLAIEKSYAKSRYEKAILDSQDEKRKNMMNRFYLTPDDIKQYAQEIKKW